MSDEQVTFFTQLNYAGDEHVYKVGDDVNLYPGDLNDKFKSVTVGKRAKVLAWQHGNQSGVYREWATDQPDITAMNGLTRFQVIADTTLPIAVRLEDGTGGPARRYSMKVSSFAIGDVLVYSGDNDFGLVGVMPEDGPPVTTAIYVRNEDSGEYVAVGSIYYVWNAATKSIDVADQTNLPENLTYQRASRNEFVFRLTQV